MLGWIGFTLYSSSIATLAANQNSTCDGQNHIVTLVTWNDILYRKNLV